MHIDSIAFFRETPYIYIPNLCKSCFIGQVLLGQYEDYNNQVKTELTSGDYESKTPTFAAVLLHFSDPQWKSVPVVLHSGKSMSRKEAFVVIRFKKLMFHPGGREEVGAVPQIRFQVNSDSRGKGVGIHLTKEFRNLVFSDKGWRVKEDSSDGGIAFVPLINENPYKNIFKDVFFERRRNQFISSQRLLEMWRIWDSFLQRQPKKLHFYSTESSTNLQFNIQSGNLIPVKGDSVFSDLRHRCRISQFRSQKCISCNVPDLIENLSHQIYQVAQETINQRGVFHLALSGGSTPKMLYRHLASRWHNFPWTNTHLWMVDERCVPLNEKQSNFRMVLETLISKIPIPYVNVHPMPVLLNGDRACDREKNGDKLYEAELSNYVSSSGKYIHGSTGLEFGLHALTVST